jgi:hypothetical protein
MADFLPQASATDRTGHGHEPNTLVVKGLIIFAVVLVAVTFFVEFGLVYVMRDFSQDEKVLEALAPPKFADDPGPFPAPRLQPHPPVELVDLKEAERHRLYGYGWVDRAAGIAHIPIDRAMDIVASSGFPPVGGPIEKKVEAAPAAQPAKPAAKPAEPAAAQDRKP